MTEETNRSADFNTRAKNPLTDKRFLLASGTVLVAATALMPLAGIAAPIGLAIMGETAIGAGLAKAVADRFKQVKQNRKAATPG